MKAQLTLRDLFWLVLVCGLVVAWWATQRARENWHHERLEQLIYDIETNLRNKQEEPLAVQDHGRYLEITLLDGRPAHK